MKRFTNVVAAVILITMLYACKKEQAILASRVRTMAGMHSWTGVRHYINTFHDTTYAVTFTGPIFVLSEKKIVCHSGLSIMGDAIDTLLYESTDETNTTITFYSAYGGIGFGALDENTIIYNYANSTYTYRQRYTNRYGGYYADTAKSP